ncbi:MAG: class I SAM-dependent methyltransferase [Paracoccaceae bacterium]
MLEINADQQDYWANSPGGQKWITLEDQLDAALGPVLDLVLNHAQLRSGERVLDIGCGTGASLLAAAQQVGPEGHVMGADISAPFVDRALARAQAAGMAHVSARVVDAQTEAFEADSVDAIISRFGVMFFEDSVAAFANMAKALRPGGRMVFAAWGQLRNNPWFLVPHLAAVERLGQPPKTDRNAPGPLAFHDLDRVQGMFQAAGLLVQAQAETVQLTPAGGIDGAASLCMKVGPAVRTIAHFDGTAEDEAAIQDAVKARFVGLSTDDPFHLPAEINLFHATKER